MTNLIKINEVGRINNLANCAQDYKNIQRGIIMSKHNIMSLRINTMHGK